MSNGLLSKQSDVDITPTDIKVKDGATYHSLSVSKWQSNLISIESGYSRSENECGYGHSTMVETVLRKHLIRALMTDEERKEWDTHED